MSQKKILILSSSREGAGGFLETAVPRIAAFIGPQPLRIAFIPFASVNKNYGEYLELVQKAFEDLPYSLELVTRGNAKTALTECDVIMTGGGNTFKLLYDLYHYKLLDLIRERVNAGTVYIGWSAGANITCLSIGTTNDMPVIEPKSLKALGFFPFQVNPHYFSQPVPGFNGETRDQRLQEFRRMNPGVAIVGLPEGTGLQLENGELKYFGNVEAVLFYFDKADEASKKQVVPGQDLAFLL